MDTYGGVLLLTCLCARDIYCNKCKTIEISRQMLVLFIKTILMQDFEFITVTKKINSNE